MFNNKILA